LDPSRVGHRDFGSDALSAVRPSSLSGWLPGTDRVRPGRGYRCELDREVNVALERRVGQFSSGGEVISDHDPCRGRPRAVRVSRLSHRRIVRSLGKLPFQCHMRSLFRELVGVDATQHRFRAGRGSVARSRHRGAGSLSTGGARASSSPQPPIVGPLRRRDPVI
jgi:hypothetical protein